jgi:hypothetical protein
MAANFPCTFHGIRHDNYMKEYLRHIKIYSTHSFQYHSCILSTSNWGNKDQANKFLKKYWLLQGEYESRWKKVQCEIFNPHNLMPDLMIRPKYEMIVLRGGCLFSEQNFKRLQDCLIKLGEREFVVIENTFNGKNEILEPAFRLRFPANITWADLTSGNFISAMIVDYDSKEYFVFGETAKWGYYSASCYRNPVNIIGFEPPYAKIFSEEYYHDQDRLSPDSEWIPQAYRQIISC